VRLSSEGFISSPPNRWPKRVSSTKWHSRKRSSRCREISISQLSPGTTSLTGWCRLAGDEKFYGRLTLNMCVCVYMYLRVHCLISVVYLTSTYENDFDENNNAIILWTSDANNSATWKTQSARFIQFNSVDFQNPAEKKNVNIPRSKTIYY